ncbi:recombinase family protein [uncultured Vagococcus sp.]|uniref:recombinase family protein n=1 Tax=uncultured Vagococcus sp. TaxID=189676 RepID=UPI002587C65E|nr:recombinase family protein [uncultured Vagococcus sp.]
MGYQSALFKEELSSTTDTITKKRAVAYIRVSTNEQAEHGYSLGAQKEEIEKFCDRQGYDFIHTYADEGVSGKSTNKRLGYQQMMSDASNGKFDVVIVWKLSRLARNMSDVLKTTEALLKEDITFHSLSENFDLETSTGRLMLQLLGSFGEFERRQISENVQLAMKSLVRDQKRFAGGRMLGYVSGKNKEGLKILEVEPEEAKIVQHIFSRYSQGQGYRAIANEINRLGYKTVKGNTFTTTAVKDILNNKAYVGLLTYAKYQNWEEKRRKGKNPNPIVVEGSHEPIISKELFNQVQKRLEMESKQPEWNNQGSNLLTGLIKCPDCGGPMAASNTTNRLKDGTKRKTRYYSCATARNKGAGVCHANSIKAEVAEKFVAARLKEIMQQPEILEGIVAKLNEERVEQLVPLEQELVTNLVEQESVNEKIQRWNDLLEISPKMIADVQPKINQLDSQLIMLKQRDYQIQLILDNKDKSIETKHVTQLVNALDTLLEGKEKKQVKAIYRSFIKEIRFDKQNKEDIKMVMYFDQDTINQLNEFYRETTLGKTDVVSLFVYHGVLELEL